ncbi:MAG: lamin tail domain-containing protein [Kiritimatiellia bacterium]
MRRYNQTLASALLFATALSAPAANVLFVVGNTTLNSGDSAVNTRLQGLGHSITLVAGPAAKVADATGRDVILVSSTVAPADVAAKFTPVGVPLMCWEPGLLDDLGMTGPAGADAGTAAAQTQVRVVRASHAIAGGLSGQPVILGSAQTLTWAANLPSAAQSVATLAGDGNRSVLFLYESGALMSARSAPARRAGFLLQDTTAAALNTSGWGLFDRTLAWLLSPPAAPRWIDPTEAPEPPGPCSRATPLVFSEIHYHPRDRADLRDLEFIELYNTEPWPRTLDGFRISGEVSYTFPSNTVIAASGFLVVAKSPADLQAVYNLGGVLGPYAGSLSNAGGTIRLRHWSHDAVLLEAAYNNAPPWPAQCDGAGHSLVLARPSYGAADPRAWGPSAYLDGSPGSADVAPQAAENALVINEILTHTDPPQVDFVEIYNHGTNTLDLSGIKLSDNPATNFFSFASGAQIAPGGRVVVTQDKLGFNLSSAGEELYLWNSAGDRILDAVKFGAKENGWSFGRWPDGHPEWHELSANTPGTANAGLRIRDVVINEVMYHPITEDPRDEWIELYNRGAAAADLSNWRFTQGVDYTFAAGTVIPAGGYLVVSADRARFLSRYPAVAPASVVGDWSGSLSGVGELIRLAKPDDPLLPLQDFVPVDEVTYATGGAWPPWADGGGSSLELTDPASDNRRGSNWADSDETAKAPWTTVAATGVLDNGLNTPNEVHIMAMGRGEMLVDKIVVKRSTDAANSTRVSNSDFESALTGWTIQGNHIRSYRDTTQGADGSSASLRIVASGGGDNGVNRAESALTTALAAGNTATLQLRGRWLRGNPHVLIRLKGNYLEASGVLTVPSNLGTPGAVNSRRVANAGPAITQVAHFPVLPAASQAVTVTARVSDPQGLAGVSLKRRLDPATSYTTTAMLDGGVAPDQVAGDGIYTASLPGQAAGSISAFYVEAVDAGSPAATTRFPATAPTSSECLVIHGQTLRTGDFGSYRLLLTQANLTDWTNRQKLSNEMEDCTVVYNNLRAVYGAGIRYRGSPFIRPQYVSPIDNSLIAAYVFACRRTNPSSAPTNSISTPWSSRRAIPPCRASA